MTESAQIEELKKRILLAEKQINDGRECLKWMDSLFQSQPKNTTWTEEEHQRFLQAMKLYSTQKTPDFLAKVAGYVGGGKQAIDIKLHIHKQRLNQRKSIQDLEQKKPWSYEENKLFELKIADALKDNPSEPIDWSGIASNFSNRTEEELKNHHQKLILDVWHITLGVAPMLEYPQLRHRRVAPKPLQKPTQFANVRPILPNRSPMISPQYDFPTRRSILPAPPPGTHYTPIQANTGYFNGHRAVSPAFHFPSLTPTDQPLTFPQKSMSADPSTFWSFRNLHTTNTTPTKPNPTKSSFDIKPNTFHAFDYSSLKRRQLPGHRARSTSTPQKVSSRTPLTSSNPNPPIPEKKEELSRVPVNIPSLNVQPNRSLTSSSPNILHHTQTPPTNMNISPVQNGPDSLFSSVASQPQNATSPNKPDDPLDFGTDLLGDLDGSTSKDLYQFFRDSDFSFEM